MKDSFIVQLSVHTWIAGLGLSAFPAAVLGLVARTILGAMADRGIVKLDIGLDALEQARKDPKWRAGAEKLWKKTTAGVYTEKEKDEIRKQYLDALGDFVEFGDGLRDNKNPQH